MKVIIVGAGKLGRKLAESLVDENIDVKIIDKDESIIQKVTESIDILTYQASGTDINSLKAAGVADCDLLIACTKEDETNAIISLLAKKLGCKKTIARLRNPEFSKQIKFFQEEFQIDYVINPELISANYIARYLMEDYSFFIGDFAGGKVTLLDYNIGHNSEFVNKQIKEIKDFKKYLIPAISRNGELIIPDGNTILLESDIIYIIGKYEDVEHLDYKFQKKLNVNRNKIQQVMMLGGGKISHYLSELLLKHNILLTIIEENEARCDKLSQDFENALIIHGDGTDIHLLEDENLSEMDAFIGLSGFDEQNLLMSLLAKAAGVSKTVAKISKDNYIKLINTLEVDALFNPIYLTISKILKYIRGGRVVSVSLLLGIEGEVTEIIVGEDAPYTNISLKDLNLPKGIIIGTIVHNSKIIIPNGDSVIYPGDRIVVFSLAKDLPTLKMFMGENKGGKINEIWNRFKSNR